MSSYSTRRTRAYYKDTDIAEAKTQDALRIARMHKARKLCEASVWKHDRDALDWAKKGYGSEDIAVKTGIPIELARLLSFGGLTDDAKVL